MARLGESLLSKIRHWIKAPRCEGAAAQQTPGCLAHAAQRTVPRNGLGGVVRTGRIKFACRKHQRRENRLVETNAREQYPDGGPAQTVRLLSRLMSSAASGAKLARATERRG